MLDKTQERKNENLSKEKSENGNPLVAFQKYLKIKNKFSEQLQEHELSMNKLKTLSVKQPNIKIS
jgi:hypothetical protein